MTAFLIVVACNTPALVPAEVDDPERPALPTEACISHLQIVGTDDTCVDELFSLPEDQDFEEGISFVLEGNIRNTGPSIIQDVVLTVYPILSEYEIEPVIQPMGDLAAGASADFRIPFRSKECPQMYSYSIACRCAGPPGGESVSEEEAESAESSSTRPLLFEDDLGLQLPSVPQTNSVLLPDSGVVHGEGDVLLGQQASEHLSIMIDFANRFFSYESTGEATHVDAIGGTTINSSASVKGGRVREDGWLIGTLQWYERTEEYDGFGGTTTAERTGAKIFVGFLLIDFRSIWTCAFPSDPNDPLLDPLIDPPEGDYLKWVYDTAAVCIAQNGTPCCPAGGGWLFDLD